MSTVTNVFENNKVVTYSGGEIIDSQPLKLASDVQAAAETSVSGLNQFYDQNKTLDAQTVVDTQQDSTISDTTADAPTEDATQPVADQADTTAESTEDTPTTPPTGIVGKIKKAITGS